MTRALAFAAALLVLALVGPRLLGYERYAITGGSMGEAVPQGSLVLAHATTARDLRPGDVATFVPAGHRERVTHRVVGTSPDGLTTRGDANPAADPWHLAPDTAVHRVVADVPHVGAAVVALGDHGAALILFGCAALALALVPWPRRRTLEVPA